MIICLLDIPVLWHIRSLLALHTYNIYFFAVCFLNLAFHFCSAIALYNWSRWGHINITVDGGELLYSIVQHILRFFLSSWELILCRNVVFYFAAFSPRYTLPSKDINCTSRLPLNAKLLKRHAADYVHPSTSSSPLSGFGTCPPQTPHLWSVPWADGLDSASVSSVPFSACTVPRWSRPTKRSHLLLPRRVSSKLYSPCVQSSPFVLLAGCSYTKTAPEVDAHSHPQPPWPAGIVSAPVRALNNIIEDFLGPLYWLESLLCRKTELQSQHRHWERNKKPTPQSLNLVAVKVPYLSPNNVVVHGESGAHRSLVIGPYVGRVDDVCEHAAHFPCRRRRCIHIEMMMRSNV